MKTLVWFRSDLRVDDNPALKKACQESDEVDAIYLYSKNQHKMMPIPVCKIPNDLK